MDIELKFLMVVIIELNINLLKILTSVNLLR